MARTDNALAIVYVATNIINGGHYVGCTKIGLSRRRYQHERDARRGVNKGAFHAAIRKYGPEAFKWTIHATFATREEAADAERSLIETTSPRYNSTVGGEGYKPRVMSAAARARLAAMHKGNTYRLGKNHSDEVRDQLRNIGLRDKEKWMLRSHLGPKASSKEVVCLNDGATYASASEAARAYSLKKSAVIEVCGRHPRRYTAGGLTFRYVEDVQEGETAINVDDRPRKDNSSGFKGVYRANNKWRAERRVNGVRIDCGLFDTPEAAHQAYVAAGGGR